MEHSRMASWRSGYAADCKAPHVSPDINQISEKPYQDIARTQREPDTASICDETALKSENPGALAGATGTKSHSERVERAGYAEPSCIASPAEIPDFSRNRWAWKRAVLSDRRLTDRAKLLAVVLVDSFAHHQTGRCTPSNATLADCLGRDVRTVRRAVAELRELGWIETAAGRGPGARMVFTFLSGDGQVQVADPGKVAGLARYRAENRAEKRTDQTATVHEPDCEKRTAVSREADKVVHPYYIDEPKREPKARADARPTFHHQVVHAGTFAEKQWDEWLTAHNLPRLRELDRRAEDQNGIGFDMPWRYPPSAGDAVRVAIAQKFVHWAWAGAQHVRGQRREA